MAPRQKTIKVDPEEHWEFWREIVLYKNGKVNKSQIKKELADYSILMGMVGVVYQEITGGMYDHPFTPPSLIIKKVNQLIEDEVRHRLRGTRSDF